MVGSKLMLAFIKLEIRQFASAFSISSLALTASAFPESVMDATNTFSGAQMPSCPLTSGGVAPWISGFPAQEMTPLGRSVH